MNNPTQTMPGFEPIALPPLPDTPDGPRTIPGFGPPIQLGESRTPAAPPIAPESMAPLTPAPTPTLPHSTFEPTPEPDLEPGPPAPVARLGIGDTFASLVRPTRTKGILAAAVASLAVGAFGLKFVVGNDVAITPETLVEPAALDTATVPPPSVEPKPSPPPPVPTTEDGTPALLPPETTIAAEPLSPPPPPVMSVEAPVFPAATGTSPVVVPDRPAVETSTEEPGKLPMSIRPTPPEPKPPAPADASPQGMFKVTPPAGANLPPPPTIIPEVGTIRPVAADEPAPPKENPSGDIEIPSPVKVPSAGPAGVTVPPAGLNIPSPEMPGGLSVPPPAMSRPSIDAPKIGVPTIDAPKIDVPSIEAPKIGAPSIPKPDLMPPDRTSPAIVPKSPMLPTPTTVELPGMTPPEVTLPKMGDTPPPAVKPDFNKVSVVPVTETKNATDADQELPPEKNARSGKTAEPKPIQVDPMPAKPIQVDPMPAKPIASSEVGPPPGISPVELPKVEPSTKPTLPTLPAEPSEPAPKVSPPRGTPDQPPPALDVVTKPTPAPVAPETKVEPTKPSEPPAPASVDITPTASTEAPRTDYDVDLYTPKAGETFETVSRAYYGDGKYAEALRAYNGGRPPGTSIQVPPMYVLRRQFASAIGTPTEPPAERIPPAAYPNAPTTPPAQFRPERRIERTGGVEWSPAPGGTRTSEYKVPRDGMKLWDVAEDVYGNRQDWRKVWQSNPQIDPNTPLPAGAQLRLP